MRRKGGESNGNQVKTGKRDVIQSDVQSEKA
jgi:hypothetical protein